MVRENHLWELVPDTTTHYKFTKKYWRKIGLISPKMQILMFWLDRQHANIVLHLIMQYKPDMCTNMNMNMNMNMHTSYLSFFLHQHILSPQKSRTLWSFQDHVRPLIWYCHLPVKTYVLKSIIGRPSLVIYIKNYFWTKHLFSM